MAKKVIDKLLLSDITNWRGVDMRWSIKKLLAKHRVERLKKAKEQIELLRSLEYQERLTEQQESKFWADYED